jgi:thiosulfate/3-mercaptopyruvate sulfurtransferase
MNNLVSTEWLEKNLEHVKLLDATWHMPLTNRDAYSEFLKQHIKNANFFDLNKNSSQDSTLPHMLPSKNNWEKTISDFGITNSDHVVIYDNSDVISSCRVWYNFLYFNHNANFISVLDGGLKKWLLESRETTRKINLASKSNYLAKENKSMVLDKNQINLNIINKKFQLIDARNKERFYGLQPEPRKELNNGHIKNSKNLPFTELINNLDNTFKNKAELEKIFKSVDLEFNKGVAFTCGSGVTACILGLANSIISGKNPIIYDGSWSEYGLK